MAMVFYRQSAFLVCEILIRRRKSTLQINSTNLSFIPFVYRNPIIVPFKSETTTFGSEQRAMFSQNAMERKCCAYPWAMLFSFMLWGQS